MKVKKLTFENYRNLEKDTFVANEGINVIYGDNAQGKTNLIEAIWLFTGIKSFQGAKDGELINFDKEDLALSLNFIGEEREQNATIKINEKKEVTLNGIKENSVTALAGKFTAVVFSPDHLFLIKKGPAERRRFLNSAISQLWPKYMPLLFNYNRALQQRNAMLKDAKYHTELLDMIEVYEEEIVKYGVKIAQYRQKYIDLLRQSACKIYEGLSSEKEVLEIFYENFGTEEGSFRENLLNARHNDIKSGVTSVGPHREDLNILIDNKEARVYGSQGQQRSAVLSLKLAEAEVIKKITGEQPVILLDDVMSELDEARQDYILNHIKGKQVFITCCDENTALKLKAGGLFRMREGKIEK